MYFLLQFRHQGHALLCIRHDLVSVFRLDSYKYIHNLMTWTLEIVLQSFQISNFSQTPQQKGLCGPLPIPSPTFIKLAAHFKVYWNPWLIPVSQWTTVAPRRPNAKHFKHWLSLSSSGTEIWRREKREACYLNPHMLAWAGWMPTSQSCYRVGNCIKLPHNYNLELYSAKSYHCLEINKLSMNKSAKVIILTC